MFQPVPVVEEVVPDAFRKLGPILKFADGSGGVDAPLLANGFHVAMC